MKLSISDKNFTLSAAPPFAVVPSVAMVPSVDTHSNPNPSRDTVTTQSKDMLDHEKNTINSVAHLTDSKKGKIMPYPKQAYNSEAVANKVHSEKLSQSVLKPQSNDFSYTDKLSFTENDSNTWTLFIKSLLSDKLIHSINLASLSFFISGMLLMFYLISMI